jgi:hypothetical protein
LSSTEQAAYDLVPAHLAAQVRVVRGIVPGPYAGITLGRFVILDHDLPADGRSVLLAHELVHARQWAELGVVGFLVRYLAGFTTALRRQRRWQRAYRDISLEQEARAQAEAWRQRHLTA